VSEGAVTVRPGHESLWSIDITARLCTSTDRVPRIQSLPSVAPGSKGRVTGGVEWMRQMERMV
jgi:hypothetical protein